jgi:enoyl-CoA hydratase/carnithine racemase
MLSPETESAPIAEEIIGSIFVVRFSRPSQRNTLSTETLNALAITLNRLKTSPSVRSVIFTGTADAFASGADINELTRLEPSQADVFSRRGQQLTDAIANLSQLTIAAINGFCMGGGLDLALACDIRIASKSAVFAHPGSKLGIITGWGGTQRLPRLIGKSKAIELFSTGRRFSSDEALKAGLVTQIADPVLEAAIAMANKSTSTS